MKVGGWERTRFSSSNAAVSCYWRRNRVVRSVHSSLGSPEGTKVCVGVEMKKARGVC